MPLESCAEPLPLEILQLCNHWEAVPPLPRVLCACGQAYVVDGSPGEPCNDCRTDDPQDVDGNICRVCLGTGWTWPSRAAFLANNENALIPCPVCSDDGPFYD